MFELCDDGVELCRVGALCEVVKVDEREVDVRRGVVVGGAGE